MENNKRRINAQQLSVMTGVSVKTLDIWYMWKRLHPEHELHSYFLNMCRKAKDIRGIGNMMLFIRFLNSAKLCPEDEVVLWEK